MLDAWLMLLRSVAVTLLALVVCGWKGTTMDLLATCRNYLKARSALTLVHNHDGKPCSIHVLQTSAFLISLAVNSRLPLFSLWCMWRCFSFVWLTAVFAMSRTWLARTHSRIEIIKKYLSELFVITSRSRLDNSWKQLAVWTSFRIKSDIHYWLMWLNTSNHHYYSAYVRMYVCMIIQNQTFMRDWLTLAQSKESRGWTDRRCCRGVVWLSWVI